MSGAVVASVRSNRIRRCSLACAPCATSLAIHLTVVSNSSLSPLQKG
jgi:hypothetical protein